MDVEPAARTGSSSDARSSAGERYFLLADISGYTGFMAGVEETHGVDFSLGIPAAYDVLGALLDAITEGVAPDFALVKLEGDAVFAVAPADALDRHGDRVVEKLTTMYESFTGSRDRAEASIDHVCTACPTVAGLDLKIVLHRGHAVHQRVGSGTELLGPAVTIAHRLLKNTIRSRIGFRPYLFITDAAADALGLSGIGIEHREEYPDAGSIQGRVVDLG